MLLLMFINSYYHFQPIVREVNPHPIEAVLNSMDPPVLAILEHAGAAFSNADLKAFSKSLGMYSYEFKAVKKPVDLVKKMTKAPSKWSKLPSLDRVLEFATGFFNALLIPLTLSITSVAKLLHHFKVIDLGPFLKITHLLFYFTVMYSCIRGSIKALSETDTLKKYLKIFSNLVFAIIMAILFAKKAWEATFPAVALSLISLTRAVAKLSGIYVEASEKYQLPPIRKPLFSKI